MQENGKSDQINLMEYWALGRRRWRLMAVIVGVVVVATAVVSLLMTKMYESRAVIIPAGVLAKDQGAASTFLATQFGLAPPTTPASAEILNLLRSNVIKEKVVQRHNLVPVLLSEGKRKGKTENEIAWECIRTLQKMTTINFTPKDNVIDISVRYKDPEISAKLVNAYLNELTEHMSGEAKRVAERNKQYLEAQIDGTSDPFIRAKIYSLIAQQIETSTMAEVKENFAFKTVDPPRVPDRRVSPKRTLMVAIAFVVSCVVAAVVAMAVDGLERRGIRLRMPAWRRRKDGR